jgi:CRISPR/Cas system CSM-associated protein Csm4 (group 5 of RAMP superfamily)
MSNQEVKLLQHIHADYHKVVGDVLLEASAELLVFAHFGDFTPNRNEHILEAISCTDINKKDLRQTTKRVVTVLVEMLQNISIHGERGENGLMNAYCVVAKGNDYFRLCSGNMLNVASAKSLMRRLELLTEFDKEDLRTKIRQRLSDEGLSDKGGAGLGLLTIAKKAEKGWSYRFDLMENEMVYFQLNVSVPMVEK